MAANGTSRADQATPAQGTPLQATALQATPAQGTPLQATPLQATPLQATPAQATPAQGAADPAEQIDLPRTFVSGLLTMFQELNVAFPECQKLPALRSQLCFFLTNDSREDMAALARDWYANTVKIITPLLNKDVGPLLTANINVLTAISFSDKWHDPGLSASSRDALIEHINNISMIAATFCENGEDGTNKLIALASDLKDKLGLNLDPDTGNLSFNLRELSNMDFGALLQNMTGLLGSVMGESPDSAMGQLMSHAMSGSFAPS